MTQEHVLAALAGVTDLETKCDAIGVFSHLLCRVKEGHERQPISPLELTRLLAALDALSVALYQAQRLAPNHWQVVS